MQWEQISLNFLYKIGLRGAERRRDACTTVLTFFGGICFQMQRAQVGLGHVFY